ncbi:transcription termination/antitermination NusG family protein [Nitrospira sp. NS4]|uniref:transcription termination/antitermination NusG family protein n=1 Tax=Nitrospira sp. NS4 TaxID=3414498 RepID=UPI003C2C1CEA
MAEPSVMEWHVVRTKPHQEYLAEASLSRAGIETLYPRISEHKMIRRKMESVVSPLFPGYLFAKFILSQSRMVQYAVGVRNVVSFGPGPAVVSSDIIDGIRQRLQGGVAVLQRARFAHGDVVRIQEGPLCGLEAVFEREMIGQQRAMLLLKMLVGQVRVVLDLKSIVNS